MNKQPTIKKWLKLCLLLALTRFAAVQTVLQGNQEESGENDHLDHVAKHQLLRACMYSITSIYFKILGLVFVFGLTKSRY